MNESRRIGIIDQTLRDGPQSLWGGYPAASEAAHSLELIANAGYDVIDLWGAGAIPPLIRRGIEPWEALDFFVERLDATGPNPRNVLRAAQRTITAAGFMPAPIPVLELTVQTVVKHGVRSFWLYDCLFDMPEMERMVKIVQDAGGIPVPAVMYGLTSVHDDAFFADRVRQMASWPGVESIYVEDAPGILTQERAATLLPALRAAAGESVKLEAHFHNTTGLAPHNYITAMRAGFDSVHTASRPLANGPSLPSTEAMTTVIDHLGYTHSVDTATLPTVAANFEETIRRTGKRLGVPNEYDPRIYDHQLPGGMTGSLIRQLAQNGMSDRFDEVLASIPQVRRDLGEPIMATPFSQLVGVQATLNIITGDPYSMVADEIIHFALGHYGPLAAPMNPEVADRILSSQRARELSTWERPDTSIKELRRIHGLTISDEELLSRFFASDEMVDKVLADRRPLLADPRRSASEIVNNAVDLIAERRRVTSFSVRTADYSIELGKRSDADV